MKTTAEFNELIGKTLVSVVGKKGDDVIDFTCDNGDVYQLYHIGDCCETVSVDDICGEWADLIGSPITQAEENTSNDNPPGCDGSDSFTWTFYRISTAKGQVVIRWYGESNGCYSESVDFQKISADVAKPLPVAVVPEPETVVVEIPLPATCLLSASERMRLDELAVTGTVPVEPEQSDDITTFEDGSTFKFMPRPGATSQCILVDASGQQIAIVKNANLADFLCNAANLFVIATAKNNQTDNPLQILTKPIIIPSAAPSSRSNPFNTTNPDAQ